MRIFGEAARIWVFPVLCCASDAPVPRCLLLLRTSPGGSVEEQPCAPTLAGTLPAAGGHGFHRPSWDRCSLENETLVVCQPA